MSEWRGLHEQDHHSPWLDGIRALCTICQQDCEADDVCYCCQRNAEVERLTAEVQVLTAECALRPGQTPPRVIAHVRILEAEVERLTEAVDHLHKIEADLTEALAERDRRIEAALARLQWAGCRVRGCTNPSCAAVHEVTHILRGTP